MRWATILGAAASLTAVSAQDDTYSPGIPPSPFPSQAAAARLKIDPRTACETADDASKPRNVQLAAWVECHILAFYPYPRTDDPLNTDWVAGFEDTFHPSARLSFNGTRYNYDGFLQLYKAFSKNIGENFAQWHQFRDYYVASPDSWNATSIGGIVNGQGFNGGIYKNGVTNHAPNGAYIVVEDRGGRRWITELREQSTLIGTPLPKEGQHWPCNPDYEVCS